MNKYILDENKNLVLVEDVLEWGRAFGTQDRKVAQTDLPSGPKVSTVFIGLDHDFTGKGPPQVFETMIFEEGPLDSWCQRYATWQEAEAGHASVVLRLLQGLPPDSE